MVHLELSMRPQTQFDYHTIKLHIRRQFPHKSLKQRQMGAKSSKPDSLLNSSHRLTSKPNRNIAGQ